MFMLEIQKWIDANHDKARNTNATKLITYVQNKNPYPLNGVRSLVNAFDEFKKIVNAQDAANAKQLQDRISKANSNDAQPVFSQLREIKNQIEDTRQLITALKAKVAAAEITHTELEQQKAVWIQVDNAWRDVKPVDDMIEELPVPIIVKIAEYGNDYYSESFFTSDNPHIKLCKAVSEFNVWAARGEQGVVVDHRWKAGVATDSGIFNAVRISIENKMHPRADVYNECMERMRKYKVAFSNESPLSPFLNFVDNNGFNDDEFKLECRWLSYLRNTEMDKINTTSLPKCPRTEDKDPLYTDHSSRISKEKLLKRIVDLKTIMTGYVICQGVQNYIALEGDDRQKHARNKAKDDDALKWTQYCNNVGKPGDDDIDKAAQNYNQHKVTIQKFQTFLESKAGAKESGKTLFDADYFATLCKKINDNVFGVFKLSHQSSLDEAIKVPDPLESEAVRIKLVNVRTCMTNSRTPQNLYDNMVSAFKNSALICQTNFTSDKMIHKDDVFSAYRTILPPDSRLEVSYVDYKCLRDAWDEYVYQLRTKYLSALYSDPEISQIDGDSSGINDQMLTVLRDARSGLPNKDVNVHVKNLKAVISLAKNTPQAKNLTELRGKIIGNMKKNVSKLKDSLVTGSPMIEGCDDFLKQLEDYDKLGVTIASLATISTELYDQLDNVVSSRVVVNFRTAGFCTDTDRTQCESIDKSAFSVFCHATDDKYIEELIDYPHKCNKQTNARTAEQNTKMNLRTITLGNTPPKKFGPFYRVFKDGTDDVDNYRIVDMVKKDLDYYIFKDRPTPVHLIFSGYGFSGSGKTYTLLTGESSVVGQILGDITTLPDWKFKLTILDVYGEQPDDKTQSPTVKNVEYYVNKDNEFIDSSDKIRDAIDVAMRNRRRIPVTDAPPYPTQFAVRSTPNNPESSRAHLVIRIEFYKADTLRGVCTVMDMGGSEDVQAIQDSYFKYEKMLTAEGVLQVILRDPNFYVESLSEFKPSANTFFKRLELYGKKYYQVVNEGGEKTFKLEKYKQLYIPDGTGKVSWTRSPNIKVIEPVSATSTEKFVLPSSWKDEALVELIPACMLVAKYNNPVKHMMQILFLCRSFSVVQYLFRAGIIAPSCSGRVTYLNYRGDDVALKKIRVPKWDSSDTFTPKYDPMSLDTYVEWSSIIGSNSLFDTTEMLGRNLKFDDTNVPGQNPETAMEILATIITYVHTTEYTTNADDFNKSVKYIDSFYVLRKQFQDQVISSVRAIEHEWHETKGLVTTSEILPLKENVKWSDIEGALDLIVDITTKKGDDIHGACKDIVELLQTKFTVATSLSALDDLESGRLSMESIKFFMEHALTVGATANTLDPPAPLPNNLSCFQMSTFKQPESDVSTIAKASAELNAIIERVHTPLRHQGNYINTTLADIKAYILACGRYDTAAQWMRDSILRGESVKNIPSRLTMLANIRSDVDFWSKEGELKDDATGTIKQKEARLKGAINTINTAVECNSFSLPSEQKGGGEVVVLKRPGPRFVHAGKKIARTRGELIYNNQLARIMFIALLTTVTSLYIERWITKQLRKRMYVSYLVAVLPSMAFTVVIVRLAAAAGVIDERVSVAYIVSWAILQLMTIQQSEKVHAGVPYVGGVICAATVARFFSLR